MALKQEDKLRLYGAGIVVAILALFFVGGGSELFSVAFSIAPIGQPLDVNTNTGVWTIYSSDSYYQNCNTIPLDSDTHLGAGYYRCNDGVVVWSDCCLNPDDENCLCSQEPNHKGLLPFSCRSGICKSFPPVQGCLDYEGSSCSQEILESALCVAPQCGVTGLDLIDGCGIYFEYKDFNGNILQTWELIGAPSPFMLAQWGGYSYDVGNSLSVTSTSGSCGKIEGYITDGFCKYLYCVGPECTYDKKIDFCWTGFSQPDNYAPGSTPPSIPTITDPVITDPGDGTAPPSDPIEPVPAPPSIPEIPGEEPGVPIDVEPEDCSSGEVWCVETRKCIEIGEICEDGIIVAPPNADPNAPFVTVPDVGCNYVEDLVCGTNGVTYLNDCWIDAYNVPKLVDGQCFICGNGAKEAGEECDGTDLGKSCDELGYVKGDLFCNSDCTYNENLCRNPVCGDGLAEGDESWINCCQDTTCPGPFNCINNQCVPNLNQGYCADGTPLQTCSGTNPGYFCEIEGTLVKDCLQCQCEEERCVTGQTSCESGILSKCSNGNFVEIEECLLGCLDNVQCDSDDPITKITSSPIVKTVTKLFTPTFLEREKETEKGVRLKTRDESLNELFSIKNMALAVIFFVIILLVKDTIQGKIKWKIIFKRIKRRFK